MNAPELQNQLRAAKARLGRAAARCLTDHNEQAVAEADAANAEVQEILATMKTEQECREPECHTITLRERCDWHRAGSDFDALLLRTRTASAINCAQTAGNRQQLARGSRP